MTCTHDKLEPASRICVSTYCNMKGLLHYCADYYNADYYTHTTEPINADLQHSGMDRHTQLKMEVIVEINQSICRHANMNLSKIALDCMNSKVKSNVYFRGISYKPIVLLQQCELV